MECRKCKESFYLRRRFIDLLSKENTYLCNRCYRNYPIKLEIIHQQLEEYSCTILSMFSKRYYIDYNLFVKEYNQIIQRYIFNKEYHFIFLTLMDLNDEQLEVLNLISKLVEKDLFVFCFYVKK